MSTYRHMAALDGQRGIAALAVAYFHTSDSGGYLPNAGFGVDFFFILSGFVVALSYELKLAETMSTGKFMAVRLLRLYPMLLVGGLAGVLIAILHNAMSPGDAQPVSIIAAFGVLSLLVLPYLQFGTASANVFPFNPPIWSLFFELIVNFIYAVLCRHLSVKMLAAIVFLSLSMVGFFGLGGNQAGRFMLGFPRVFAGFFGGVLLYRLWKTGVMPQWRISHFLLAPVVLLIFAIPVPIDGFLYIPLYCALSFIVLAGASAGGKDNVAMRFLGRLSYPLYLLHWPVLYFATSMEEKFGSFGVSGPALTAIRLFAAVFTAFIFLTAYDEPVRSWLKRQIFSRDH